MDPQHTGRSPYAGPRRPTLLRTFETASYPTPEPAGSRADIQGSFAIAPDGTMYIGNFMGNLFALKDPGSGDRLQVAWRFHPPGGNPFHATPAIGRDGTVYLGFSAGAAPNRRGSLYALKAPVSGTEGQVAWSVDLGNGIITSSPALGPDGTIYAVHGDGTLYAVSPDGNVRWTAKAGPTLTASPALAQDGTVYSASTDGKLYAVMPPASGGKDGTVRWTFDFGQHLGPTPLVTSFPGAPQTGAGGGSNGVGSGASPTVAPDGTIYIGANNSNLYAIGPDGTMKWLFEAERELAGIWTSPNLSADGSTLYFGANRGGVYALNRSDGALRWRHDVYGSIYSSLALDSRGTLYSGSTIGHLFALDSTSGQAVFDYDAGQQIWSAPAIRPDGSLVVGDRSGRILLFAAG
jgi:outer membrane protein assembly factor BamB